MTKNCQNSIGINSFAPVDLFLNRQFLETVVLLRRKKLDEMFAYYVGKGCDVKKLGDYTDE